MKKFTLKREIDTTDLIKSIVTIIGAIIAFLVITLSQLKNDQTQLKLELTGQLPKLQPFIQTNYTNRIDPENSSRIEIKLYLKVLSENYIYFHPPKIGLIEKSLNTSNISEEDFLQEGTTLEGDQAYEGLFSPGTQYNINYSILINDPRLDLSKYDVYLYFNVDTDEKIQKIYGKVLSFLGEDTSKTIDNISYKTHRYREKIYVENLNFDKFFDDASKR